MIGCKKIIKEHLAISLGFDYKQKIDNSLWTQGALAVFWFRHTHVCFKSEWITVTLCTHSVLHPKRLGFPRMNIFSECFPKYGTICLSMDRLLEKTPNWSRELLSAFWSGLIFVSLSSEGRSLLSAKYMYFSISSMHSRHTSSYQWTCDIVVFWSVHPLSGLAIISSQ